jgi:hypothetical protein
MNRLYGVLGSGGITLLDDIEKAARRVGKAQENLDAEREQLHAAMRRAYREGIPIARIAQAAGMTRPRASVLVRRGKSSA